MAMTEEEAARIDGAITIIGIASIITGLFWYFPIPVALMLWPFAFYLLIRLVQWTRME